MRGENGDNGAYDVVLDGEDVLELTVVVFGPAWVPVAASISWAEIECGRGPPHAALQHIAYAQFASDPAHVDRLALVLEAGIAGDDE